MSCIRRFNSVSALFMLCLFSSLFAIQAAHHHCEESAVTSTDHVEEEAGKPVVHKLQFKCDICEYIVHKQNEHLQPGQQSEFSKFQVPATRKLTPYTASISKLSFLSWTNKGPPQA